MRVFLDTNVLIDYLAHRQQFYQNAAYTISICGDKGFQMLVSALSFATTSYILSSHNKMAAITIKKLFANFIKSCHVTPVDSQTIDESIASEFSDFEDAMQYYSALRGHADVIITRNKNDYKAALIPVYEPQEFLDLMTSNT